LPRHLLLLLQPVLVGLSLLGPSFLRLLLSVLECRPPPLLLALLHQHLQRQQQQQQRVLLPVPPAWLLLAVLLAR
jgi:hypothetical protein